MSEAKSWAIRIPAAIEKAERLAESAAPFSVFGSSKHPGCITPGEVALAKALWGGHPDRFVGVEGHPEGCSSCVALIAFTEKVEAL